MMEDQRIFTQGRSAGKSYRPAFSVCKEIPVVESDSSDLVEFSITLSPSDDDEDDDDDSDDDNPFPSNKLKVGGTSSSSSGSLTLSPSDTEELKEMQSDEELKFKSTDDDPDPTHRCPCGEERYIESAPAGEYSWCDSCEKVRYHLRIAESDNE